MRHIILNVIFLYFFALNAFSLSNIEINNVIKEYLNKNGISKNFSINKKIKLPNCKNKIEVEKNLILLKHLKLLVLRIILGHTILE